MANNKKTKVAKKIEKADIEEQPKQKKKVLQQIKATKIKKAKGKELDLLLENFTLIQKTLAETVVAFKSLQQRFDRFLGLVEKAAEIPAGRAAEKVEKGEKAGLAEKIELLIEQNKAIAEGMMLLEKVIKEKLEER